MMEQKRCTFRRQFLDDESRREGVLDFNQSRFETVVFFQVADLLRDAAERGIAKNLLENHVLDRFLGPDAR